jgi:hypothetical protein
VAIFYGTCLLERGFEVPQDEKCQIFERYGTKQEVVCNGMKRIALELNVNCKKGFLDGSEVILFSAQEKCFDFMLITL